MLGHITIALLLAQQVAASVNSFYFSFPTKTDEVPLVHNGDVLNVTWLSSYTQAILHFWCGTTEMETISGLAGDGNMIYTVNTSWTGTCHWQLSQQSDADRYVDSGFVDVTNAKATPAVTWTPAAKGAACGVSTVTATNAAASSAANAASTTTPTTITETAACPEEEAKPALSPGASMGVGVAIGAAVAGVVAAVVFCMRRRTVAPGDRAAEAPRMVHQHQYPSVHELNPNSTFVEADAGWHSRKRFTPAELPTVSGNGVYGEEGIEKHCFV